MSQSPSTYRALHAARQHAETHAAHSLAPGIIPDAVDAAPAVAISIRSLTVDYGDVHALRDVSLDVPRGKITAVIGPSGCGKSTLLSCLNRLSDLIPRCRVTGTVRLGDTDVRSPEVNVIALRRRVGMIFQKPNPLPLSIRRNIDLPLREHGAGKRGERRRIIEASLRDVGLWDEVKDRLRAPALGLSGGQQQRLCIARAIALRPEVLLLDEPCSALDPLAGGVVEDLIQSLRGRYTLVVVTHNLAQARRIADRVAFFWLSGGAGRLIETGPKRSIFESPRDELTAAYVRGERG